MVGRELAGGPRWTVMDHEAAKKPCNIILLCNVFIEVIVDPKIVADWPFPGWDGVMSGTLG